MTVERDRLARELYAAVVLRPALTEFIDGGTLDEQINSVRPPPWRKTVELLTGVADGIAAAHAANILHRDIKPANIRVPFVRTEY